MTAVKVAAYQAPLLPSGSMEALTLIRREIDRCESADVEILCCPESILGGLADYARAAAEYAIDVGAGQLETVLAPLASETVTTIVGFTEIDRPGRLYNSAAVFHKGSIAGIYRKMHPARRRSVYAAGDQTAVFTIAGLTFGIIICRDSTYGDPAETMARRGARVLFVPSNNGLPPATAGPELVDETRRADIAMAKRHRVSVIRADVAGCCDGLVSYGSSGIVNPDGVVLRSARQREADLLVADI